MATAVPNYENVQKFKAREENVHLYRSLSGHRSIPKNRQYWTLSSLQSIEPTSEINQLVGTGLLTKDQFCGVDRNEELVLRSRQNHPEAHFFNGEWGDIILECEDFNPAMVYLDTLNESGRISLNLTAGTMSLCPPDTLLLVNVAQSSRYRETMKTDLFLTELMKRVPNLKQWSANGVKNYDYVCRKTLMRTYAFYNGGQR